MPRSRRKAHTVYRLWQIALQIFRLFNELVHLQIYAPTLIRKEIRVLISNIFYFKAV